MLKNTQPKSTTLTLTQVRATISNFRLGLIKGTANNADESRWACLNALQCPDALIVKNGLKEKDKLLDGLTNWVVQDAQYVRWQSSENVSLLWINGGPGKGKTMMTISLVEQFERLPFGVHQQRPVVTYFFCQNSDSELSSIKGVGPQGREIQRGSYELASTMERIG